LAEFAYRDIPGMPAPSVEGHPGRLLAAVLGEKQVLIWQGRFHLYEGFAPEEVCLGVRVSAALGARTLVVTNASGSLNPLFGPGSLMAVTDHINLTGRNPLVGPNVEEWGPRFPDMSQAYSQRLLGLAQAQAMRLGLPLERGVYLGILGPSLETPAETRFFRSMGADAIGMSTVMEVIAARHLGLEVLGLCCLVNQNLPDRMAEISLEEIMATAEKSSQDLARLVEAVLAAMQPRVTPP
jgi:purine-nucleoside phosphorylase